MIKRLSLGAFGAVLFALCLDMATVTPAVLERSSGLPGTVAFAGLAGFAIVTVGGLIMGAACVLAAFRK